MTMADRGMTLDVAGRTDIGLKRQRNEDHLGMRLPEPGSPQHAQGALFVVADGMGGMGGGDVASQTAVAEIFQRYYAAPTLDALSALRQAISASPGVTISVDLQTQILTAPDGSTHEFVVPGFARDCLLRGLDEIGLTLTLEPAITAFEARRNGG